MCAALFSRVVLMSMTAFGTLLLCVPSVIALLVSQSEPEIEHSVCSMFHAKIECRHDVAKAIMESPLLTEEDYQLLYFVLLKPHPQEVCENCLYKISDFNFFTQIKPQFPITAPSKR